MGVIIISFTPGARSHVAAPVLTRLAVPAPGVLVNEQFPGGGRTGAAPTLSSVNPEISPAPAQWGRLQVHRLSFHDESATPWATWNLSEICTLVFGRH